MVRYPFIKPRSTNKRQPQHKQRIFICFPFSTYHTSKEHNNNIITQYKNKIQKDIIKFNNVFNSSLDIQIIWAITNTHQTKSETYLKHLNFKKAVTTNNKSGAPLILWTLKRSDFKKKFPNKKDIEKNKKKHVLELTKAFKKQ